MSPGQCKVIDRGNITFLEGKFDGIPENLLLNVIISMVIVLIFLKLKAVAWKELRKSLNEHQVSWINLLYRDVYEFITAADLRKNESVYQPLNPNMGFFRMIWFSLYELTSTEISARCGIDAVEYLRFLKCFIKYNVINTVAVLLCVLPTNLQGNMEMRESLFVRTTMGNLNFTNAGSMLWVHLCVASFLTVMCLLRIQAFSTGLKVYKCSPTTDKTILMKEVGKLPITLDRIKQYVRKALPLASIKDIKLVYKYNNLIYLNRTLRNMEEALNTCNDIWESERRRVLVKKYCWCCFYTCQLPPCTKYTDGENYYTEQIENTKKLIAEELRQLPKRNLRYAFVTFKHEYSVFQAKRLRIRFLNFEDARYWKISKAPDPANIIWENVRRWSSAVACKTIFINSAVFCIAVFLTTPTIILSSSGLEQFSDESKADKLGLHSQGFLIARFLPSLIVWCLSIAIPALVTYSSGFLDFQTKSGMNKSIMLKTVIFLIFTVVILPSLSLTSISAFVIWTIAKGDKEYEWGCIFLPDNGSFFVGYVMTSALIGTIIQLLRPSEIFFYAIGVLMAKSEAERITIRKSCMWEFSYGIQYGHSLLILTLVMFYSIPCPVIAPFGLVYFVSRFIVDRYNIIFAYPPSRASIRVHTVAIQVVIFALIMQNIGLFSIIYIRGGTSDITHASQAIAWITLIICICIMNPCKLKYLPSFLQLLPQSASVPPYDDEEDSVQPEEELFHPFALKKFVSYLQLDEYDNPLPWTSKQQQIMHESSLLQTSSSH